MRRVSERIPVRFGLFNHAPAKRRWAVERQPLLASARNKERSLAPGSSASLRVAVAVVVLSSACLRLPFHLVGSVAPRTGLAAFLLPFFLFDPGHTAP